MATGAKSSLELLADRRSYPERTTRIDQVETHISWVFLTDRFAYKLKKPVRFDFLDFSTVEKRRAACLREVRLNRRLAPDIYLDVVPITKNEQSVLALGPREGAEPIDWLVRMRRLPCDQSLEHLIRSGRLRKPQVTALSRMLSEFYHRSPPLTVNVETYRRQIENHIKGNYRELSNWAGDEAQQMIVRKLQAAQLRLLRLAPELLDNRVLDGRIVDGHGDLRPEHIYFHPQPIAIDCIEFNDEFRQLDVLDELAFLAIECDRLGAPWVGEQIINHYEDVSNDHFSQPLLDFYKTYRCCVRAKVAVLRARQIDEVKRKELEESACTYFRFAESYAADLSTPILLVVYGLSGSGKSTLANKLSELLGIDVLNTDMLRREMFGTRSGATKFGSGIYQPAMREQVYDEMLSRAEGVIADGVSLILDGTFSDARLRCRAVQLARRHNAAPVCVHCQCPDDIAVQRILARMSEEKPVSDATPDIYERQRYQFDPDSPELDVCHVDTSQDLATVVETVFSALRSAVPFSLVRPSEHSQACEVASPHDHAIPR